MSYLVHLRQFEGPLGLLLYLIRKEEMDVFDINVGEITRQYLEYIRMMKELDLEVAGEFIAMAATLIHIKSRMLLPQYNEEGEVVEQEDPRKELVQKLLEYQKYQEVAKKLYERPLLNRDVYARGSREAIESDDPGAIIIEEDGLFSLISAYRRSIRKAQRHIHKVRQKVQSIAGRVMEIKERLIVGSRVLLRDLLAVGSAPARTQLLVTFLSLLELGRMGYVSLFQADVYGDIHIDTKKAIERNVLERVQEFEAADTEALAKSIIDEATEDRIDMEEAMAADEDATLAAAQSSPQLTLEESLQQASLEAAAAIEAAGSAEIASDEEILMAEMELGEVSEPLPVIDVEPTLAAIDLEVAMPVVAPALAQTGFVETVNEGSDVSSAMDEIALAEPQTLDEMMTSESAVEVAKSVAMSEAIEAAEAIAASEHVAEGEMAAQVFEEIATDEEILMAEMELGEAVEASEETMVASEPAPEPPQDIAAVEAAPIESIADAGAEAIPEDAGSEAALEPMIDEAIASAREAPAAVPMQEEASVGKDEAARMNVSDAAAEAAKAFGDFDDSEPGPGDLQA